MDEKIRSNIREAIEKSGFPLELEISAELEKDWWVRNSDYYYDYEGNKGRDIDIVATPNEKHGQKEGTVTVLFQLVIECKKSTKTQIFFQRPISICFDSQNVMDTLTLSGKRTLPGIVLTKAEILRENQLMAIAYDEIEGNKSLQSHSIFEAINQISKYIEYRLLIEKESIDSFGRTERLISRANELIYVFFPCIVFDGLLCSIDNKKGNEIIEVDNMLLMASRKVRYFDQDLPIYINVVKKEAFPKFIEKLDKDILKIEKFFNSTEWLN